MSEFLKKQLAFEEFKEGWLIGLELMSPIKIFMHVIYIYIPLTALLFSFI